jgi:hypothetical protein
MLCYLVDIHTLILNMDGVLPLLSAYLTLTHSLLTCRVMMALLSNRSSTSDQPQMFGVTLVLIVVV